MPVFCPATDLDLQCSQLATRLIGRGCMPCDLEIDPQAKLHRAPINKAVNAAPENVPSEGVG